MGKFRQKQAKMDLDAISGHLTTRKTASQIAEATGNSIRSVKKAIARLNKGPEERKRGSGRKYRPEVCAAITEIPNDDPQKPIGGCANV